MLKIACGRDFVNLMVSNKHLYSYGIGENGWLGHGHDESCSEPQHILKLKDYNVVDVVCTEDSSAVIVNPRTTPFVLKYFDSDMGEQWMVIEGTQWLIYTWGAGMHGCLGMSDTKDRFEPTLLIRPDWEIEEENAE